MSSKGSPTVSADEIRQRFDRVQKLWRPGAKISAYDDIYVTVLEVRLVGSDAVVIFGWLDEPKPFGLHIDLCETSSEFYYGDPVDSFDDWIEYLDVYVMVSLGTGLINRSQRIDRDDYVGLREPLP